MIYIKSIRFEWDPEKAQANRRKHKISFRDAASVLASGDYIIGYDANHSTVFEERFFAIGRSRKGFLFIVFLEFETDYFRIVSARKATLREIKIYEEK